MAGAAIFTWHVLSPIHAVGAIDTAARADDHAQIEEMVDLASFKTSLTDEIRQNMTETQDGEAPGTLRYLGADLTAAFARPIIDNAVTPANIAALIRQASENGETEASSQPGLFSSGDWEIEREGFDAFVARQYRGAKPVGLGLRFSRNQLNWTLTAVELN
ncbi:MAG: DUF2939 domain-containing protein [Erythrobacter sp.]